MGFWMWVLTVVGGLVVLLIVLFVVAELAMRRRGRLDEQQLAGDPDRLQRLAEAGDLAALLAALQSPSDEVSRQAVTALMSFTDARVSEALLWNYFDFSRSSKEAYAEALARRPAEDVVPRVLERLSGSQQAVAIELLRRFDLPAARDAVERFDQARALAEAQAAKRNAAIQRLLSTTADAERTRLRFALPIETGADHAASKIVGGLLTGGIGAVAPNKFSVDDLVKLPEECAFCGCLPGKTERWASCSFQLASAGWGLVGVNTAGEVMLTYRVCAECSGHDEQAKAIVLSIDKDDPPALILQVAVLNSEIAARIRELSAENEQAPPR